MGFGGGGSAYFVVACIAIRDVELKKVKRTLKKIREKYGKKKKDLPEIKGNKLPPKILEYALRKISDIPFVSAAVFVEKGKTYQRIKESPRQRKRHYNYIVRNAIQNTIMLLPKEPTKVLLEMDIYHEKKINRDELERYLKMQIGPYVENVRIVQKDSMSSQAIQIADILAYSVNKYLQHNDGKDKGEKAKVAYKGILELLDSDKLRIIKLY